MASISGVVGASDSHAYSASKGAVINLTRAMAISYGPNNIRVNAVSPGMVDTAMSRARANWKEVFVSRAKEYPLSRIGHPIDIAYGCLYLASDESSWVTGTNLVIDGGFTAQ
jgi:NAD(P)-dependent dehydrogenase (short-subunit alcohol dehydrogenase family)